MAAEKPEFTRVGRFQRGYAVEDVDAFLREFARALEQGSDVPDVMEARFTSPFGGYDMVEVDEFLEDLRSQVAPPQRSTSATVDDVPTPPAFTTSRFRRGYNIDQVEAFLADVMAAVRDGREPP
ncbi:MAG: DivIVA domain-containing protein, partial [Ornithinimicrobium sp.]